jgi:hypothetical protein
MTTPLNKGIEPHRLAVGWLGGFTPHIADPFRHIVTSARKGGTKATFSALYLGWKSSTVSFVSKQALYLSIYFSELRHCGCSHFLVAVMTVQSQPAAKMHLSEGLQLTKRL